MRDWTARLPLLSAITMAAFLLAGDRDAPPKAREASIASLSVPFLASDDPAGVAAFHAWTFAGPVIVRRDGAIAYAIGGAGRDASSGAWRKTTTRATLPVVITERFAGATPTPREGARSATNVSVLRGERSQWRESVPAFASVDLGEAWPGIRVTLQARASSVEKVFTVAPGASPDAIRVDLDGVESLRVDEGGALVAATAGGDVAYSAPVAWQEGWLGRTPVDVAYAIDGATYRFVVGDYDRTRPLWIDPLLQSTYVGGSNHDYVFRFAVHPQTGAVYAIGRTDSSDFPQIAGGADTTLGPGEAIGGYVARYSSSLTALEQATFIAGDGLAEAFGIAIDPASGDVFVGGLTTDATNWPGPTTGAPPADEDSQAFVARLPAALTSITLTRFFGGSGSDSVHDLAIHPGNGDLYAAGFTQSDDFPSIAGGGDTTHAAGDGFVTRMPLSLASLTQSTFLGGAGLDGVIVIRIAPGGDVYAGGQTVGASQATFPSIAGGADTTAVDEEGFVARITADLTSIVQSTFVGGETVGIERVWGLAFHPVNGDLYVSGDTVGGATFPGIAGGADTTVADRELFVARLSPALTTVIRSTYYGGDGNDNAAGPMHLLIHPDNGDVYLMGNTTSSAATLPALGGEFIQRFGASDFVIVRIAPSLSSFVQATLLGGPEGDTSVSGLAYDPSGGGLYASGITVASGFPRIAGGGDTVYGGIAEGTLSRLTADLLPAPSVPVPVGTPAALVALAFLIALGAIARARTRRR